MSKMKSKTKREAFIDAAMLKAVDHKHSQCAVERAFELVSNTNPKGHV